MNNLHPLLPCVLLFSLAWLTWSAHAAPLYKNDFQTAEPGKVPEELMVMEGAFVVKEENGNRFLELPGTPLETFGLLFGPTETTALSVEARIHGTMKGRRAPTFAVGLNGVGGFKLQVAPGKKALELYKGEELLGSAAMAWESGSWTFLRLTSTQADAGAWRIEGKAWKEGGQEPAAPQLTHVEKSEPIAGKASVWGAPFSGTPIRFDDLRVSKVNPPS